MNHLKNQQVRQISTKKAMNNSKKAMNKSCEDLAEKLTLIRNN